MAKSTLIGKKLRESWLAAVDTWELQVEFKLLEKRLKEHDEAWLRLLTWMVGITIVSGLTIFWVANGEIDELSEALLLVMALLISLIGFTAYLKRPGRIWRTSHIDSMVRLESIAETIRSTLSKQMPSEPIRHVWVVANDTECSVRARIGNPDGIHCIFEVAIKRDFYEEEKSYAHLFVRQASVSSFAGEVFYSYADLVDAWRLACVQGTSLAIQVIEDPRDETSDQPTDTVVTDSVID